MAKAQKPKRNTATRKTQVPEVEVVKAQDDVTVKIFKNSFYPEDTEVVMHRLAAEKMERLGKGKIVKKSKVVDVDELEDDTVDNEG